VLLLSAVQLLLWRSSCLSLGASMDVDASAPSLKTKDPFQLNIAYFVKSMLGTFHDFSLTEQPQDLLVIA
jgi:hypothetical protein